MPAEAQLNSEKRKREEAELNSEKHKRACLWTDVQLLTTPALPAGKAPAQDQDRDEAMKELHETVLRHKTFQELQSEIIPATKGCIVGMHYAGSECIWMQEVGYTGKMVNLHQMVTRFFDPLRKLV
jgi:hypothetical protein